MQRVRPGESLYPDGVGNGLKGIEPEGFYISKSVSAGKTEALLAGANTRRQININR